MKTLRTWNRSKRNWIFPWCPHFTTLQKFFCRIKTLCLRHAFRKTLNLFYCNDYPIPITAIDSFGFTSGYSSHYYLARTGKTRKHFLKTSISVNADQQGLPGASFRKAAPRYPVCIQVTLTMSRDTKVNVLCYGSGLRL